MRRTLNFLVALVFIPGAAWPQGAPLGTEFRVNTYTTLIQGVPSVAADGSGNFVVVWSGGDPFADEMDVFGQRYASSGVPLGPEFRVNTYTTRQQASQSVASDAVGNFVVVWSSVSQPFPNNDDSVFGQRYASSGTPLGPEFRVNTATTFGSFPAVASDPNGNLLVVFSRSDGSFSGVFGQRYASSGAPLGSEFRVNTHTPSFQGMPAAAADAAGNFVVVWQSRQQDGDGDGVFGQRFANNGAPLGPEFRVNTFFTFYQQFPSVAAASNGFVVVWSSYGQDGSDEGVFGQRYAASGSPLGPEFRVNTHTPTYQRDAAVAADSAGNFVVVWQSMYQDGPPGPGGGGYGIFGQRYASTGTPSGTEFRVNTYTPGTQYSSAVAAAPGGNFVVVWASPNDPLAFESDVYGQRYGQIVPVELMRFQVE